MLYESTGKDYASEWIALPEEDKKSVVIDTFMANADKYYPDSDIGSLISKYEEDNRFDDVAREITQGYKETGLRKPYQVVC